MQGEWLHLYAGLHPAAWTNDVKSAIHGSLVRQY